MINKEESVLSSNTSFKFRFKLIKREVNTIDFKYKGLYEQIRGGIHVWDNTRTIKLMTNSAGKALFDKTVQDLKNKNKIPNKDDRKRIRIRSKIFK